MFPIMLNIRGRKCTVAGGGNVAERKVKTLLKYGADVTAVSPVFKDGFPNVKRLEKEYSSSDIENSFLVIAATDNKEVNQTIYNDAKKRNILVSLSDDTEHSDFIFLFRQTANHRHLRKKSAKLNQTIQNFTQAFYL